MSTRTIVDLQGKKLEIELAEVTTTLYAFDWDSLSDDAREPVFAYFLDEDGAEAVEAGRWVPFGVLGLTHSPDSFAEVDNDGLLVLVPQGKGPPSITWVREDGRHFVAESLDAVEILFADEENEQAKKGQAVERYREPP